MLDLLEYIIIVDVACKFGKLRLTRYLCNVVRADMMHVGRQRYL